MDPSQFPTLPETSDHSSRSGMKAGMSIGPFTLLRLLGKGGMGAVYLAEQQSPYRKVALKFMSKMGIKNRIQQERFLREAEISANLDHPNIVKAYMAGFHEDVPYLAISYVEGQGLNEYLVENGMTLDEKLRVVETIALALGYAHQKGVIHRDIKPSNIMIQKDGKPILMDFGIAKSMRVRDKRLTQTGELVGTPNYMSPEQARGDRDLDSRTDIYSLGGVLYEIILRKPLYSGISDMAVLYQIAKSHPLFPRQIDPDLSPEIEAIILRCLERDKSRRYQKAEDLADDIHRYLEGKATRAAEKYASTRLRWHVYEHKKKMILLGAFLACVSLWASFSLLFSTPSAKVSGVSSNAEQIQQMTIELGKNFSVEGYLAYLDFLDQSGYLSLGIEKCDEAIQWARSRKSGKEEALFSKKKARFLLKGHRYRESYAIYRQSWTVNDRKSLLDLFHAAFECGEYREIVSIADNLPFPLNGAELFYYGASVYNASLGQIDKYGYHERIRRNPGANGKKGLVGEKVQRELEKCVGILEKIAPEEKSYRRFIYMAYALLWNGEFRRAKECLAKVDWGKNDLQEYERMMSLEMEGLISFAEKNYEKSRSAFSECIRLAPWECFYYYSRAYVNVESGQGTYDEVANDSFMSIQLSFTNLSMVGLLANDIVQNRKREEIFYSFYLFHSYNKEMQKKLEPALFNSEYHTMARSYFHQKKQPGDKRIKKEEIESLLRNISNIKLPVTQEIFLHIPNREDVLDVIRASESSVTDPGVKQHLCGLREKIREKQKKEKIDRLKETMARFIVGQDIQMRSLFLEKENFALLKELLYDRREKVLLRYWTAKVLLALRTLEAHGILKEGCAHSDPVTQVLCIAVLSPEYEGIQIDLNGQALFDLPDEAAAIFLHQLGKNIPVDLCYRFLERANERVKVTAAKSILAHGDPAGVKHLVANSRSESEDVRSYAYWWLFSLVVQNQESQQELAESRFLENFQFLEEKSPWVRKIAIKSLMKMPSRMLIPALQKEMENVSRQLSRLISVEQDDLTRLQAILVLLEMGKIEAVLDFVSNQDEKFVVRATPLFSIFVNPPDLTSPKELSNYIGIMHRFASQNSLEKDPDPRFRMLYLTTLGIVGDTSWKTNLYVMNKMIVPKFQEGLEAEDKYRRKGSAHAAIMMESSEDAMWLALQKREKEEKDPGILENVVSSLAHIALRRLERDENPRYRAWIEENSRIYPKAVAYGYYRFMEKIYRREMDGRLLDITTAQGRDQAYETHLFATWSNFCRLWGNPEQIQKMKDPGIVRRARQIEQSNFENLKAMAREVLRHVQKGKWNGPYELLKKFSIVSRAFVVISYLEEARKLAPDNARYHFEAAFLLECVGEWRKALDALNEAIKIDSERELYRFFQARVNFKLGNLEEAMQSVTRIAEKGTVSYSLFQLKGMIHAQKKEWEKARESFSRQHAVFPYRAEPLIFKAHCSLWLNDRKGAERELHMAQSLMKKEEENFVKQDPDARFLAIISQKNCQSLHSFEEARYLAQIGAAEKRIENYLNASLENVAPEIGNYSDSPFTRENLGRYPEFRTLLEGQAFTDLPKYIVGLTDVW